MRGLLLSLMLMTGAGAAEAARHDFCTSSWRVGQRVVKVGDDVGRALNAIERAHQIDWLRGPGGKSWTLVRKGYNAKTIRIKLQDGRLQRICQSR